MTDFWNAPEIDDLVKRTLAEDLGDGDHTSLATVPKSSKGKAKLLVKQEGVIAGIPLAKKIFEKVDRNIDFDQKINEGDKVLPGNIAFFVSGSSQSILMAERLALNFMQRLSGIATLTHRFGEKIKNYDCQILDTRKTTPGLRLLEKYAVRTGGGANHRMGLYDMVLIKDNHIDFCGSIAEAIQTTRTYLKQKALNLKIEIETRNLEEVQHVLNAGGVDRIMLDNFSYEDQKRAVEMTAGRFETEASGNVRLETVEEHARTGVDYISSGALTHSAIALDLSLKAME